MISQCQQAKSRQHINKQTKTYRHKSCNNIKKSKQKKGWVVDIRRTHYKVFKEVIQKELKWKISKQEKGPIPNIIWTDFYVSEDQVNNLLPFQKINHFPSSFQLGNKSFLSKNIAKMKKKYPNQYQYFPDSWQLPEQLQLFKYQKQKKKMSTTWILKPANLCQGKGIIIINNIDSLEQKVKQSKKQYVIQSYIENPYLINNLKFDLRLYVLVQSLKPLQIFLYKDGLGTSLYYLARFATNNYQKPNKTNLTNNFMHLTNFAINKKNPNFSDEEQTGHKRKLSSILDSLIKEGKNINPLMQQICKSIVYTIISVQPLLSHLYSSSAPSKLARGKNCFQIFGFDFLIDEKLNPSLLQVNHTPSFKISSQVDNEIKSNLIKDTLKHLYNKNKNKNTQIFHEGFIWDTKNSLNYIQVYPVKQQKNIFEQILNYSQHLFDVWTGVSKKVKTENYETDKKQLNFAKKKPIIRRQPTQSERPQTQLSKRMRKTMTSFDRPISVEISKIIPTRVMINRDNRAVSGNKKFSLNSAKILGQQKTSACIVYDFLQKNIEPQFMQKPKQVFCLKQAKRILLKSFNSKQYKNVRTKGAQTPDKLRQ